MRRKDIPIRFVENFLIEVMTDDISFKYKWSAESILRYLLVLWEGESGSKIDWDRINDTRREGGTNELFWNLIEREDKK